MKKILSVFVALVLVFALCAMPASAETKTSEWKKGTGPATKEITANGTVVKLEQGVSLWYYQNQIDITDFEVVLKLNAPEYREWGWFAMTIGGTGKYTGGQGCQNFLVLIPRGENNLCINPQVLHSGQGGIVPQSTTTYDDIANEDLKLHFKKVNDSTYSVEINDHQTFEYLIPENFDWTSDLNGKGCLGFGGCINPGEENEFEEGAVNIVVKSINGVAMTGTEDKTPSTSGGTTGGTTGGSDTTIDPETGIDTGIIGGGDTTDTTTEDAAEESGDNTLLIVVIICGAVLLLAAIAAVIVIVLVKSKKAAAPVEEATEEAEETTEE